VRKSASKKLMLLNEATETPGGNHAIVKAISKIERETAMTDNPYTSPASENNPVLPGWHLKIILQLIGAAAVVSILIVMLLPAVHRGREPARRTQCKNNLKQIGMALQQYHDSYGSFPPAYTVDADGKRLHSWRTLILPFIDQVALYNKIDLSKAWDDPVNGEAARTMPAIYICPATIAPPNNAHYVAIVGADTCFPGAACRSLTEIKDGPSQTLAVVEVNMESTVPWMSPMDVDEKYVLNLNPKSKVAHVGGIEVLFADATVRFLSNNVKAGTRRALMTANAHDTVDEW
jgi:type II secretory pathway pseudopilin PulG